MPPPKEALGLKPCIDLPFGKLPPGDVPAIHAPPPMLREPRRSRECKSASFPWKKKLLQNARELL